MSKPKEYKDRIWPSRIGRRQVTLMAADAKVLDDVMTYLEAHEWPENAKKLTPAAAVRWCLLDYAKQKGLR
jgi:hypothetical protein